MTTTLVDDVRRRSAALVVPVWFWVALCFYGLVIFRGDHLLEDPDMLWQIAVGQWIIGHRAVPTTDVYSFTMHGAPWMSSSWLAQVLYAAVYKIAGWAGPVALGSAAIAATFAIFVRFLAARILTVAAIVLALAAFLLSSGHFLARPHLLALPVMVAWMAALLSAAERRVPPSPWSLLLLVLWANLHGSFVLGLALAGAVALEAVWTAKREERISVALRWALFGLGCIAACCLTPYGWHSLLAARKILDLGEVLSLLEEWKPVNVNAQSGFEIYLLIGLGLMLYRGLTLSPPRIVLMLALLHMALSHVRNLEVLLLLGPLVLAQPLSAVLTTDVRGHHGEPFVHRLSARHLVVAAIAGLALAVTLALAPWFKFEPNARINPAGAVAVLKERGLTRVFNDYDFGGYLIANGVAPFIDGRAELYGEKFVVDYYKAARLERPDELFRLLDDYKIDATLLTPGMPANLLLDRMDGWQRVYSDAVSVLHVRVKSASEIGLRIK